MINKETSRKQQLRTTAHNKNSKNIIREFVLKFKNHKIPGGALLNKLQSYKSKTLII